MAILALGRGERVEHAARLLDVSKQSILRWRDAWERQKRPQSLEDRERPGRPREWTEEREALLMALLERSPSELGYRAMSWTTHMLSNQMERALGWRPSERSVRQTLRDLEYVYKRPRYVLVPDPQLAKNSPKFGMKSG